jgi:hypothetical protein
MLASCNKSELENEVEKEIPVITEESMEETLSRKDTIEEYENALSYHPSEAIKEEFEVHAVSPL